MIELNATLQRQLMVAWNMRITVQLDPKTAREITLQGSQEEHCPELARLLRSLSVSLVPLHPGTRDDALKSYFAIEVPASETAASVVKQLRPCRGIRAAYVKPTEALPR